MALGQVCIWSPAPARASAYECCSPEPQAVGGNLCHWMDTDDGGNDAANQLPDDCPVSPYHWRPRNRSLAADAGHSRLSWPANAGWISAAVILTIAGLYQFSSLKYACLDKCRSPLSFLVSRWQGGNESAQALRIGLEHGLFCVGCCWSLMLLMYLVNAGSLVWMLLLGVVMALEKNFPWGRRLSAPIGVLLFIGAIGVVVAGIR